MSNINFEQDRREDLDSVNEAGSLAEQVVKLQKLEEDFLKKEDELKDRVSGLEYIMKIAHETSILEWDYRRDKFLVTSLNLKLTEKKYEKNFIRCELTRKKAPITFDAKWF